MADAQAILMTLMPGKSSEGSPRNEHPGCEQWMYRISGEGNVVVKANSRRRNVAISAGSLLPLEKRESHQMTASEWPRLSPWICLLHQSIAPMANRALMREEQLANREHSLN